MHQGVFTLTAGHGHSLIDVLLYPAISRRISRNIPAVELRREFQPCITFAKRGLLRAQEIGKQELPGILVKFDLLCFML
ncbi:hypothetical protein HA46_00765 [Pantoea septica]|uniref:Uncharacterized protein n=1 Tax=Pantoea septica TaxID=472695 RepID=A0ABX3UXM6_9GAMM|nr:hypothetical protein HA46_00765 [Pantoea septica]